MKRGFTLLELIIVLIIIAVLAALGVPQYIRVTEKSRQAEAVRNLGAIRGSQLRYYTRYSDMTTTIANLDVTFRTRYFDVPTPLNPCVAGVCADTPVANSTRNSVELPGGYNYTIYIYKDGTVSYSAASKTDVAPSATRPGL